MEHVTIDNIPYPKSKVCHIFPTPMILLADFWNINKHKYIDSWILRIFRKYHKNIDGYFDKNIDGTKIIQNSWECLKKTSKKNNKISNNTHVKIIL